MGLLERFVIELGRRSYAPRTVRAYTSSLRSLFGWLGREPEGVLPREVVESYLIDCVDQGRSRSHLDLTLSALKVLYVGVFGVPSEQLESLRPPRQRRAPAAVPSPSEVWQIADAIPARSHRLAVLMMYGSGLRLKEVVALRVGDVDCVRCAVVVRDPLGQSQRQTILHTALLAELGRQVRGRGERDPLLPGTRGQAVTPRAVRRSYQKSIRRTELRRYESCAVLRAAFVSHQLAAGTPLGAVQEMIGPVTPPALPPSSGAAGSRCLPLAAAAAAPIDRTL
jgi:integrase/recombinase XerD